MLIFDEEGNCRQSGNRIEPCDMERRIDREPTNVMSAT
jgi:hypothetical protein